MSDAINDLLNNILDLTDEDELKRVIDTAVQRAKALREERARTLASELRIGDKVRLQNISPKYLDGATGTVANVPAGKRVPIKLDHPHMAERFVDADGILHVPSSSLSIIAHAHEVAGEQDAGEPQSSGSDVQLAPGASLVPFDEEPPGGRPRRKRS